MIGKRNIVHGCIAAVLAVAVVSIGVSASHRAADPVCAKISIVIKDSLERQYVSADELHQQLHQAGLWQVGQPLSRIYCQQIEQHLLSHPMLRKAECYEMANGEVRVMVWQRQPMVLIKSDEVYYLDTERKVMPVRASVQTPVVVVSGRIGRQQAQGEMFDFVKWLKGSKFWRDKIHAVRVVTPKMIELTESSNDHTYTIVLGPLEGAEDRLDALEKLYEKGFDKIGYPGYKQIDLQYKNQIIGRK